MFGLFKAGEAPTSTSPEQGRSSIGRAAATCDIAPSQSSGLMLSHKAIRLVQLQTLTCFREEMIGMLRYVIIFLLIATLILGGCRKTTITEPQKHPVTITLQQPTVQQPKQSTQTKERRHINIFQYIFYLGVIFLIFDFIWNRIFVLIFALISALLIEFLLIFIKSNLVNTWKTLLIEEWIPLLIKAFGFYLLTSSVVALTLGIIKNNPNILSIILFAFIGVFALYITFASNLYEA
jgi:hypothetical protein